MTATWPDVADDIRKAMTAAGSDRHEIDKTLLALQPIVFAVERAGTKIDIELAWALLACLADQRRRAAVHARLRRKTA